MGRPHQAGALDQGGGRNSGRARQKGGGSVGRRGQAGSAPEDPGALIRYKDCILRAVGWSLKDFKGVQFVF